MNDQQAPITINIDNEDDDERRYERRRIDRHTQVGVQHSRQVFTRHERLVVGGAIAFNAGMALPNLWGMIPLSLGYVVGGALVLAVIVGVGWAFYDPKQRPIVISAFATFALGLVLSLLLLTTHG